MNTPKDATDSQIHALFGDDLALALHTADVVDRINQLMTRSPDARRYDLLYSYTSYAPVEERWTCIDQNTFDGAPDAVAPATFIGRGGSEKRAKKDLLEQFAEFDEHVAPKPRASRVIFSSPYEPPEYADDRRDPNEHAE